MTEKTKKPRAPKALTRDQIRQQAERLNSTELVKLSVEISDIIDARKQQVQQELQLLGGEAK